MLLTSILKAAGYTDLLAVGSARDAFKRLGMDDCVSVATGVDLILMDITMPEMDGIAACREIKAKTWVRDIPIIMVTAHTEAERLESAFAAGAMDYITKPVSKVELRARVRSALALKGEMDARKQAYVELEQKNLELEQVSLAKTQILSTASHELKTPLTSIVGYVNRLLMQQETVGALNERQARYLETVQRNSLRLKVLIDDLLDISRIESGSLDLTLTELEVQGEIQEVIRSIQDQIDQKEMCVILDVPPELSSVRADRLRFSQVMTNLLGNACKYSPVGATTTIKAIEVGGYIQFDVSDTGIGMSKADLSRLFTKFFRAVTSSTREVSGTGLGLFITRHLVEAQEGKIWVESEEGKGSTFSFTLPRADAVIMREGTPVQSELNITA